MLLKTQRLQIRNIKESDWQSVKRIWEDFSTSQYAQYDMPHSIDDREVRVRMARWEEASHGREHLFFAVCLKEKVIGYIAFNKRPDSYEAGYCFYSDYAGMGYAKESHLALFEYLKNQGISKKITVRTALKNIPSMRLLQSLGFEQVGQEKVSFYQDAEGNDIVFDGGIFELTL